MGRRGRHRHSTLGCSSESTRTKRKKKTRKRKKALRFIFRSKLHSLTFQKPSFMFYSNGSRRAQFVWLPPPSLFLFLVLPLPTHSFNLFFRYMNYESRCRRSSPLHPQPQLWHVAVIPSLNQRVAGSFLRFQPSHLHAESGPYSPSSCSLTCSSSSCWLDGFKHDAPTSVKVRTVQLSRCQS